MTTGEEEDADEGPRFVLSSGQGDGCRDGKRSGQKWWEHHRVSRKGDGASGERGGYERPENEGARE